ncbi:MAG: hypothetical protein ABGY71_07490 [bacterium]|nr:hypothetical protein [Planctomycetota bacterium]
MRITTLFLALLAAAPAAAQRGDRGQGPNQVMLEAPAIAGIAWFGVIDDARAEAKRTGKPILLMSAAPACSGVPGMW